MADPKVYDTIELKLGADSTTAETVSIQSIEWTEHAEVEDLFVSHEREVQDFIIGKFKVTGSFVVKSYDADIDTYMGNPRTAVPYMHGTVQEIGGTTTAEITFGSPVYLAQATNVYGISPEVAKRTVNFVAKSVTGPA